MVKYKPKRSTIITFCTCLFVFFINTTVAEESVSDKDIQAVQLVIGNQISALKTGDGDSAYFYAAPNVKQAFPSAANFINMVQQGYKPLYQHRSFVFGKHTLSNGEIYQELIITDETRKLWQFIYTLSRQEDSSWKVTNVVMYPFKGTSV